MNAADPQLRCAHGTCAKTPAAGKKTCKTCLARQKRYDHRKRAELRTVGLCLWIGCGKPAEQSSCYCPEHRDRNRQRRKREHARKKKLAAKNPP